MKRIYTQPFCVVGAIVEKNGKILLVREASGYDKGKWNQPAGWLEIGENPIEAAKREVEEETGLEFEPTHLLGIYSLVRKDLQKTVKAILHPVKIIFVGKISASKGKIHEDVAEAKWFLPEEIYKMDKNTLRDPDIKKEVKDYFAGKVYPLDMVSHTVRE